MVYISPLLYNDENCYSYLLSTKDIGGNTAFESANLTFYPNLPEAIQYKHRIHNFIATIPKKMFRLDDY